MCKTLINDKLSVDFYQRISIIILLFAGLLIYINLNSGIGIYNGFFHTSILIILFYYLISTYFNLKYCTLIYFLDNI